PQSINASYDRANNKWAQSWWKILGYTSADKRCVNAVGNNVDCPANQLPINTTNKVMSILNGGINSQSVNGINVTESDQYVPLSDAFVAANLGGIRISQQQVRTVELIPRQNSINVNDIKLKNHSGALNVIA